MNFRFKETNRIKREAEKKKKNEEEIIKHEKKKKKKKNKQCYHCFFSIDQLCRLLSTNATCCTCSLWGVMPNTQKY